MPTFTNLPAHSEQVRFWGRAGANAGVLVVLLTPCCQAGGKRWACKGLQGRGGHSCRDAGRRAPWRLAAGQPQALRQLMATSPQPAWCWVGRPRGTQQRICRKKNCVQPDTHPKAHRWPQGSGSLGTWVGPATSLPPGPFGESPQPSSPSLALPTTPMFVPQAL